MKARNLTPKQLKMLEFIEEFKAANSYVPSQAEIAKHFGFSSLGTIQNYLNRIERAGFLKRDWNAKRALTVKKNLLTTSGSLKNIPHHNHNQQHLTTLPLLGWIAAGSPIEAIQEARPIEVPQFMLKPRMEHYLLKIKGDSMIDEGILDGDFVIVQKTETAKSGDVVVALIDSEATIKRLNIRKDEEGEKQIELLAANSKYAPIRIRPGQDFRIQGIYSGLLRKAS